MENRFCSRPPYVKWFQNEEALIHKLNHTHTVKKKDAMHTKYGVLRLSRLEHLIWREVTPNIWCVFYAKLGVLSHQLSVLSH